MQIAHLIIADPRFFPNRIRVEDLIRILHRNRFLRECDHIAARFAGILAVQAIQSLEARIGDFLDVFGNFDLRCQHAVLFECRQLIDTAEYRLGFRGNQTLADAEGVDLRPLQNDVADNIFIQRIGYDDRAVRKPRFIEHLTRLFRQIGYVAGVDTDTHLGRLHFLEYLDRRRNAGFQHIVGVHQQHAVVRIDFRVLLESGILVRIHLHPAVRHRSQRHNAVISVRDRAGCTGAAADISRARAHDRRVRAMRSAGTEFHDRSALCRAHNAARLGRNHTLVVDAQKHHRLDELCLHHRSSDGHDRLMREDRRSLRHRPDITLELKITQIRKKIFAENIFAAQICDVLIRKSEVLEIVDELFQTRHDRVAAAVRHSAEEHIEIRDIVRHAGFKIAVCHGDFIKICEHRQIHSLVHWIFLLCFYLCFYFRYRFYFCNSFFKNCPV